MTPLEDLPGATSAPVVEVRDLTKRYRQSDVNAVDGVSFSVAPGEFFTLLGPNGAGKTTTISILTTTLTPTGGSARVAGYDVVRDAANVRRSAGIIFQTPSLDLNLTAEENVRFHAILYGLFPFRPAYRLMPETYKRRVGDLGEVLGIAADLFKPLRTFSGGMKRKLEILRSLVHSPRVLFLDEPTTGLDPASRRSLWSYLRDVRAESGTTLVLTTHYLEEAEGADRICILARGRVVSLGAPAEVKADLVERYVEVDSQDRPSLLAELKALGVGYAVDGRVRLAVSGGRVHEVLRAISTPLDVVETHTPSLEDAYLAIVERSENGKDSQAPA